MVTDSRYYVVRYTSTHTSSNPRYRYMNSTVLNCMLDDLKPNTQFEFAVKVIKVNRHILFNKNLFLLTNLLLPCRTGRKVRGAWWCPTRRWKRLLHRRRGIWPSFRSRTIHQPSTWIGSRPSSPTARSPATSSSTRRTAPSAIVTGLSKASSATRWPPPSKASLPTLPTSSKSKRGTAKDTVHSPVSLPSAPVQVRYHHYH